ncbi:MAG TPA: hypothetical protein QGF58_18315 [Myxococcota bacterium]|nr:hypothetical protein [Myxococcota bacterium]
MLFLVATALAAPKGFAEGKSGNGCTIYIGPENAQGIGTVHAECHWPEQTVEEIDQILGDVGIHDDVFTIIIESTVLSEKDGTSSVRQVHRNPPLDDRELVELMGRKTDGDAIIHWWTKAKTQPAVADGRINTEVNTGKWVISEHEKGGVSLVYVLDYAPGGSVPSFVIRAFQGTGIIDFLGDLRAYTTAN